MFREQFKRYVNILYCVFWISLTLFSDIVHLISGFFLIVPELLQGKSNNIFVYFILVLNLDESSHIKDVFSIPIILKFDFICFILFSLISIHVKFSPPWFNSAIKAAYPPGALQASNIMSFLIGDSSFITSPDEGFWAYTEPSLMRVNMMFLLSNLSILI